MLAIRRDRAVLGHRQRQLGGRTAVDSDRKQTQEAGVAVPRRTENDLLAVARPTDRHVWIGMVGEPFRHAPSRGDHVDVEVPFVFAGEGNQAPIGRKDRIALESDSRREAPRVATRAIDRPQIAGIGERDLRGAHSRHLQQEGRFGLWSRFRLRGPRFVGSTRLERGCKQGNPGQAAPERNRSPGKNAHRHRFPNMMTLNGLCLDYRKSGAMDLQWRVPG